MKCHHKPTGLPYVAAHVDADRRLKRGERQQQCPVCRKWFWAHETPSDAAHQAGKAV